MQISARLPIVLQSLFAEAMTGTLDQRRVMPAARSFMLAVPVLLAVFAWAGLMTLGLLLPFTFLVGSGPAMKGPAWHASADDIVLQEDLPSAVALNSVGLNIARCVGSALGGAILAADFAINALSYLGLIAVLARW